jgi:hypothetical protein
MTGSGSLEQAMQARPSSAARSSAGLALRLGGNVVIARESSSLR